MDNQGTSRHRRRSTIAAFTRSSKSTGRISYHCQWALPANITDIEATITFSWLLWVDHIVHMSDTRLLMQARTLFPTSARDTRWTGEQIQGYLKVILRKCTCFSIPTHSWKFLAKDDSKYRRSIQDGIGTHECTRWQCTETGAKGCTTYHLPN